VKGKRHAPAPSLRIHSTMGGRVVAPPWPEAHVNEAFDFRAMFLGDAGPLLLLEIAFRTAFTFLYTILLLRVMGKRGVARLSSWQYVIIVALGSAVGDPMLHPDVPLIHGCAVITTIVSLEWFVSRMSVWNPDVERVVIGDPVTLIRNGIVFQQAMHAERVTAQDLREFLRQKGIASVDQVESAVLEDSGNLSVLVKDGLRPDPALWTRGVKEYASVRVSPESK
jgi:uncharacterized membrane protein YcaP (DUF421 family)